MTVDPDLLALYRAARAEEAPTPEDLRAVQAGLMAVVGGSIATPGTAAATALGSAASAAKAVGHGKLIGWVLAGVAAGGAATSVAVVLRSSAWGPAPARSVEHPEPAKPVEPTARASHVPTAAGEPEGDRVSSRRAGAARKPVPQQLSAGSAAATRSSLSASPSSLDAEAHGLLEIQRALGGGSPERALALLIEQEQQFRSGTLVEERAAARVLVLCATGQIDQARLARSRFLSAYPDSTLARRVRGSCAE